jgi:2-keto-4-pentenoate hydratase/2-oxohepta-3-ene-1,7-dioic acid hydratase in catechol pathway
MKVFRFNGGRIGVANDSKAVDVTALLGASVQAWPPVAINGLIRDFDRKRGDLEQALTREPALNMNELHFDTPVPWPNKLIAYPVNYYDHATEMSSKGFANVQGFFLKANSSLIGASDRIELPNLPDRAIHHECEIGLIIGKEGREVGLENAMDYVFGYSCLIDVTIRGKEERVMRKSYDCFTPVGPWIVTKDEIADPANISMRLWVNDELRQEANTRDLIVDIPNMVALASSASTLYPGDIIATGTPAGVGPIRDGDIVTIEVEGVGRMRMPVVAGKLGANFVFNKPAQTA